MKKEDTKKGLKCLAVLFLGIEAFYIVYIIICGLIGWCG